MARPLADKTDAQVLCRIERHAWLEVEPDPSYAPPVHGEVVWWACSRDCGAEKIELWSKVTGERLTKPSYRRPANYSVDHATIEAVGGRTKLTDHGRLEYLGRRNGKYQQRARTRSVRAGNGK